MRSVTSISHCSVNTKKRKRLYKGSLSIYYVCFLVFYLLFNLSYSFMASSMSISLPRLIA